ncbi:MFS transporter [Saccharopolyspora halophila]|uniref:MFS transporter n=1 Tax=Saccharopolyspora halophila TaxID=405551 RepID=A0ABN3GJ23_9PSEU
MQETETTEGPSRRTILAASLVGTSIEWYDYYIFGTAAALVFGTLFYPQFSSAAGTIAAFGTFAVGFIARPLGAALFGHFGDRIGRKSMLVITLVITGGATFLIGLLPTYAAIGLGAPLLLIGLRLLQGLAVGGEWGGAVLIATEHADSQRRAFYGSFAQFGVPVGVLTSNLAFLLVSGMPDESFMAWGWRIPFLLSIVLIVVGILVRARLEDSRQFAELKNENQVSKLPLGQLVRREPRNLILGSLASIAPPATGYMVIVYMLTYGTQAVGFERSTLLTLILLSTLVWILTIVLAAVAADRYGAKNIYILGAMTAVVWPFPMFALVDTANAAAAGLAFFVAAIVQGIMSGSQGGLFTELFDVQFRYSGISIAYQMGGMIGGALTPIVATALYATYGSSHVLALYLMALCAVSLVTVLGVQSRSGRGRLPRPAPETAAE